MRAHMPALFNGRGDDSRRHHGESARPAPWAAVAARIISTSKRAAIEALAAGT